MSTLIPTFVSYPLVQQNLCVKRNKAKEVAKNGEMVYPTCGKLKQRNENPGQGYFLLNAIWKPTPANWKHKQKVSKTLESKFECYEEKPMVSMNIQSDCVVGKKMTSFIARSWWLNREGSAVRIIEGQGFHRVTKKEAHHSVTETARALQGWWFWLNASGWFVLWFLRFCSNLVFLWQMLLLHPHLIFHFCYFPLVFHSLQVFFHNIKGLHKSDCALGRKEGKGKVLNNVAYWLKWTN